MNALRDGNEKIVPYCTHFHPRPNEHFGIATVEAMAAGCLPVVHASRGPLEVIGNERHGLVYTDTKELPELINSAFDLAKDFQHKLRTRALDFDIVHFKKKFGIVIDKILDNNYRRDEV
jgi:glycosyltransferase involved in cell wall biosynthesis